MTPLCSELQQINKSGAIRVAASPPAHPSPMGEINAPRGATKARQLSLLLKKNFFVSKRNVFATTVRRLFAHENDDAPESQAVL